MEINKEVTLQKVTAIVRIKWFNSSSSLFPGEEPLYDYQGELDPAEHHPSTEYIPLTPDNSGVLHPELFGQSNIIGDFPTHSGSSAEWESSFPGLESGDMGGRQGEGENSCYQLYLGNDEQWDWNKTAELWTVDHINEPNNAYQALSHETVSWLYFFCLKMNGYSRINKIIIQNLQSKSSQCVKVCFPICSWSKTSCLLDCCFFLGFNWIKLNEINDMPFLFSSFCKCLLGIFIGVVNSCVTWLL